MLFLGFFNGATADGDLAELERKRLAKLAPSGVDVAGSLATASGQSNACLNQFKTDRKSRRRKFPFCNSSKASRREFSTSLALTAR